MMGFPFLLKCMTMVSEANSGGLLCTTERAPKGLGIPGICRWIWSREGIRGLFKVRLATMDELGTVPPDV